MSTQPTWPSDDAPLSDLVAASAHPASDAVIEPAGEAATRVNLRTVFLGILAALAVLFALYVARAVFVPMVLACVLSLVLSPVVRGFVRLRVPCSLAAAIVVAGILGTMALGMVTLAEPATEWLQRLPIYVDEMADRLKGLMREAAKLDAAEAALSSLGGAASGDGKLVVAEEGWRGAVFVHTSGFLLGTGTTIVLLYFLLAMGDSFLRKLVLVLPHFRAKKQAVEIARQIQAEISHYLLTVTAINLVFGATVALAMHLTGMPNPLLWGAMAALANYVPFLGHFASFAVIALVALLSFPEIEAAAIPPLCFAALAALEGNILTPLVVARRLTLNPVAVTMALLAWGWMWGTVGLLLAVPLLVVTKIAADRIASLRPLGEFLGD